MASEVGPVSSPVTGPTQESLAPAIGKAQDAGGKKLPQSAQVASFRDAAQKPAYPPQATSPPQNLAAQVELLNRFLNDSGQPDQYRIAPLSGNKLIQQINPVQRRGGGGVLRQRVPGPGRRRRAVGAAVNGRA